MGFPVETNYRRWGWRRWRHTPDSFMALGKLRSGLHLIGYGAVELGLLVKNREASATFYGFHAAQSPVTRRPVPYFQGRKIAPKQLNMVLISDPSLYLHDEVRVGWFLGNTHCELLKFWPAMMDKIDVLLGSERRLLWGNSAGGTAALRYARDEDTSVVMNPQIILERFTWGRVEPWIKHGWSIEARAEQIAFANQIGDLRNTPPKGRIVYCQNTNDTHVKDHLQPLAEVMNVSTKPGDDGRFKLILDDWGKGHIPPSSEIQQAIVGEEVEGLLRSRRGVLGRSDS